MQPYPFQKEGVYTVENKFKGRAIIADDMGLGKTLQALWFIQRHKLGETLPAVVVCPASVKFGWAAACNALGIYHTVLEGTLPPIVQGFGAGVAPKQIYIINYDVLEPWMEYLTAVQPCTLIVDECQEIKNKDAQRTAHVTALGKLCGFVIALSGTPLDRYPYELYTILHILRPDLYKSEMGFCEQYSIPKRVRGKWVFTGSRNLAKLNKELLQNVMIRRLYADVENSIPPKKRRAMMVDITKPEEYAFAENNFLGWLQEYSPRRARRAAKNEAMVRVGYLKRLAGKLKFKAVCQHIDAHLAQYPGRKLCVFAVQRKMISSLVKRFKGRCLYINGEVPTNKREHIVRQFRHDKNIDLFLGNVDACGTGMDGLQHACSDGLLVEQPWTPTAVQQLEARVYRLGQTRTTRFTTLVARGTIEVNICKLLQNRQGIVSGTLDGGAAANDFNVMDLLLMDLKNEQ